MARFFLKNQVSSPNHFKKNRNFVPLNVIVSEHNILKLCVPRNYVK